MLGINGNREIKHHTSTGIEKSDSSASAISNETKTSPMATFGLTGLENSPQADPARTKELCSVLKEVVQDSLTQLGKSDVSLSETYTNHNTLIPEESSAPRQSFTMGTLAASVLLQQPHMSSLVVQLQRYNGHSMGVPG